MHITIEYTAYTLNSDHYRCVKFVAELRLLFCLFVVLILGVFSGCGSTPTVVEPPVAEDVNRVLQGLPRWQNSAPPQVGFLDITPAMKDLVRDSRQNSASDFKRLRRLVYAIYLRVRYDVEANLTAAEVYRQGRANCLSYSGLIILLAREAGLRATFQEVDLPPQWDQQDEKLLVRYQHVNVIVNMPDGSEAVVDFLMDRYSKTYARRLISDQQATALYYSNLGSDHMFRGNNAEAFQAFKMALVVAPDLTIIWSNLGLLYRRAGENDLSEISYRQALKLDPKNYTAMGNLATLYVNTGKKDEAAYLGELSKNYKLQNPYYRYAIARKEFQQASYDLAISQLKVAIEKHPKEHRFHHLLGLIYWRQGQVDMAILSMNSAHHLAEVANEEEKFAYDSQVSSWQKELHVR